MQDYPELNPIKEKSKQIVDNLGHIEFKQMTTKLTPSQFGLLWEVKKFAPLSSIQLAQRLDLERSSVARAIKPLISARLIKTVESSTDKRVKFLQLTKKAEQELSTYSNQLESSIQMALTYLSDEEREIVLKGLTLYSSALHRSIVSKEFSIRRMKREDNIRINHVISQVLSEFGYSAEDYHSYAPEMHDLYRAYSKPRSLFNLVERNGIIVGGAGIRPLESENSNIAILEKMYFLSEARKYGMGKKLLSQCLEFAKSEGFKACYLEAVPEMHAAIELYKSFGFKQIPEAIGNTGHYVCDLFFKLDF